MAKIQLLRLVTERDAREITELLRQLYGSLDPVPTAGDIQLHANENELLIARDEGGSIIGMATLISFRDFGIIKARAEDVVVREDTRKSGIGRHLMSALSALARDKGARFLELLTWRDRPEVLAFYSSLGFTVRDRATLRLTL